MITYILIYLIPIYLIPMSKFLFYSLYMPNPFICLIPQEGNNPAIPSILLFFISIHPYILCSLFFVLCSCSFLSLFFALCSFSGNYGAETPEPPFIPAGVKGEWGGWRSALYQKWLPINYNKNKHISIKIKKE